MSYSDYDSDGYASNEDADYVPSDDNLSEDDMDKCEKEDPLDENDTVQHHDHVNRKKKKNGINIRKRKKIMLRDAGGRLEEEGEEPLRETTQSVTENEEKQKKKSDDLWESFLQDVGSRPKDTPVDSTSAIGQKGDSCGSKEALKPSAEKGPAKVTITKVFDFAGEEVWVNKEVSADSREAKSFQRAQSNSEDQPSNQDRPPAVSSKRPAGISTLLGHIGGKKPKISTLEKSKMDWDAFKSEEGITEELAIHNRGRDGYVERKNFLERVDHRQFEREKAVRLSNMKQ
ncbi:craniofacial development protein 1 [Gouania willdenowi]|uniref:Craniofacial development protein 1 n=1 Tax=Gouania willdenowi TaxID=441366 RepID=A0A8C5G9T4_GOUWI|nr:craniofacial development protein 1 [Gouania willdenowi]